MAVTFPRIPGFADLPPASIAAEEFAIGANIARIIENAHFGMVRPELFVTIQVHGDTVPLPKSNVDGYQYSRDELAYSWAVQTTADQKTGQITAGFNGSLWFCQWFVNPDTGKVTCEEYYARSDGRDKGKTNDGVLLVFTWASRRKNTLTMEAQPYFEEVDDAEITTDDALRETPLGKLNRSAKFSVVNCEAIYMGTYKNGQVIAPPQSPVDGYQYTAAECIWIPSWVWTTNGDQYVAPKFLDLDYLDQFHRLQMSVDPDGTVHTAVYYSNHSQPVTAFGRIAVTALCQRSGTSVLVPSELGYMGLCGAFVESGQSVDLDPRPEVINLISYGAVKKAIAVGLGGNFVVPAGADHLQLGINDTDHFDNVGAFNVTVTALSGTWTGNIDGDTRPWIWRDYDGIAFNQAYRYGNHAQAIFGAPKTFTVPLVLTPGETITITYNSGLCDSDGAPPIDKPPEGTWPTGQSLGLGGARYPTYYMDSTEITVAAPVFDDPQVDFVWIDPNKVKAGNPLKRGRVPDGGVMTQLNHNINVAVVRPEVFNMGDFENGDVVPLPVSLADGYEYTRDECYYVWEMRDTSQPAGEVFTDNRTIRVISWSANVNRDTGAVTCKMTRLRDDERIRFYTDGILTVKVFAVRLGTNDAVPTDTTTVSDEGTSSPPENDLVNGGMDGWSSNGQTIADGWRPTGDESGDYSYSDQPGLAPVGSSQGIQVDTGAGNQAGIRSNRLLVYKGQRYVERYLAKASVAIASGFSARVRFWNDIADASVYVDLPTSGPLGTSIEEVELGIEIPASGATDVWTSLDSTVSIVGTLDFDPAWITVEFMVIQPSATTTVSIDNVEWVRAATNLQGNIVAKDNPADGDVLTYDATAKEWLPAAPAGGGGAIPVAFTAVFPGTATGRTVWAFMNGAAFTLTIAAGLTNWKARVGNNPSATKTFSFKKSVYSGGAWGAPVEFGTLDITSGGVLTWTSASGATIGNNEALVIVEPTDGDLADVSITVHGTR